MKHHTAGAVVSTTDPLSHHTAVSYADSFSDSNNGRNTLAYPTTATDADGYSSTLIYNFDFGAVTSKQTPQPNTTANLPGPVQTVSYDGAGRIERTTSTTNGAYTRYIYGPNYVQTFATVNTLADEAYSIQVFDGVGRVTLAAGNHPGSSGGYRASNTIYDAMGRAVKQSNPTEVTSAWLPAGDDASGWLYSQQTYDWKGRPLITTNTDGTTKEASYAGCGCAGGEVVTLTDEGTIDGGVAKRRQQNIYSDVLGRTVKTEILNWQGGSVYSTTVNSYNARDQVKLVRQYAGPEDSATYQDTTTTFDGYGRVKTTHAPEQDANAATTFDYNADDTVQSVIDARGASQSFTYNARHLVTGISYAAPSGITPTSPVTYGYDATGNRISMTDGLGSVSYQYNQLSRMTAETRTFSDPNNSAINGVVRTLSYDYNPAGELKSVTDPFGSVINYGFDTTGRLNNITGVGFGSVTQFVSNMQYRAWGSLKSEVYGNGFNSNAGYDARLHIQNFALRRPNNATVMADSYQYYADGGLKFSDSQEEWVDRSYSYDHSGRVAESYSGSEARDFINGTQSGMPTGPYRQSFHYDAFSRTTQQVNRFWSQTKTTDNTFVDNRRQGWSYDADGRLMHDDTTTYVYDAAGLMVQRDGPPFHGFSQFDGDGLMIYNQYTSPYTTPFVIKVYYLRSTALGGWAVAELNLSGQKTKGNVYAGDRNIAEAAGSTVTWHHEGPLTGSLGDSDNAGSYTAKAEFNADGVNVGFEDPAYSEPTVSPKLKTEWPMLAPRGGCTGTPCASTCYVNGFEHDCGMIYGLMQIGVAAQCPDNHCGPSWQPNRDGPGRGGWQEPVLGPRGFISNPLGPSTRPPGMQRPTLKTYQPGRNGGGQSGGGYGDQSDEGHDHVAITPIGFFLPQNSYDPRVDFRDYAVQLSTNGDPNDCRKLALLAYKAGQVFSDNTVSGLMNGLTEIGDVTQSSSDPNYRVGVLRRDPYFGNGFGTGGFLTQFQDHSPGSQNQVRHFVGWFAAGAFLPPPVARRQLWDQEGTRNWNNPDVALGQQAINMGYNFSKTNDGKALAEAIWRDVCGGKGKLIP
jgi:YD repeat-containing protein